MKHACRFSWVVIHHFTPAGGLFAFHGYTAVRELELLEEAEHTPNEALAEATSNAAEMLGIDDKAGCIAVGLDAGLVILQDDPRKNLSALLEPGFVVRERIVITPRE